MRTATIVLPQVTAARYGNVWRFAHRLLMPLAVVLALLIAAAPAYARPAAASCAVQCYYRISIIGHGTADFRNSEDDYHVDLDFKLESNVAVTVSANGSTAANLAGHLTKYAGRVVRREDNLQTATTKMHTPLKLAGTLEVAPQPGPVYLGVQLDPSLLGTFTFDYTDVWHKGIQPQESPIIEPCDQLSLPHYDIPLDERGVRHKGPGNFSLLLEYHIGSADGLARGTSCYASGGVSIYGQRCPDQNLSNNCAIKGWPPLPRKHR